MREIILVFQFKEFLPRLFQPVIHHFPTEIVDSLHQLRPDLFEAT